MVMSPPPPTFPRAAERAFPIVPVWLATALWILACRDETPTTASAPASPPASRLFPLIPKMVGESRIMPFPIAFLYQSTEKCGMDGGSSEKLPEMEKCGSLIFGSSQLKLKMPLSLSTIPDTKLQMPLNTLLNTSLMPFRIPEIVLWIALKAVEMPVCMAFTTPMTTLLMPFQTVVKTVWIALKTVLVTVWMVFHAVVIKV